MYNSKFLKISIHLVYFSLLIFIGFIVISAMFYPGTTIRDHGTVGYNIFNNFKQRVHNQMILSNKIPIIKKLKLKNEFTIY